MSQIDRLERELTDWFAETASPRTPSYVEELVSSTRSVRQRPRWMFLDRWLPARVGAPVGRTLRVVPWRTLGLVALLGLLLAAALAIYVGSQRRELPAPYGLAHNGLVAYGNQGDIYTVDPITAEPHPVVTDGHFDHDPRFSLDGSRLAFLRDSGADALLVVTDVDGGNLVMSDVDPFVEADSDSIAWSPSGGSVAVAAKGLGGLSIHLMDTTDGDVTSIHSGYYAMEAHWRPPDGREIMFVGGPWPHLKLSLVSLDDGRVTNIVPTEGAANTLRPIGWTPDGRKFAYQIHHPELGVDTTHFLDIQTRNEFMLRVAYGRISNAGDRIVGFDGKADDLQLCVARLTDDQCVPISDPSEGPDPEHNAALQWSPDDQFILVRLPDDRFRIFDPEGLAIKQPDWVEQGGESIQRTAR